MPRRLSGLRSFFLFGSLLLFCGTPGAHAKEWWNGDWSYRQHIGIDSSLINEDLDDFRLWVRLTDAQFARVLAASDGRDLRAVGQDGQPLPLQIVSWTPDDVRLYVRIPRIRAGTSGQGFDLYFGNSGAAPQTGLKVWDESDLTVLHLAATTADATGREVVTQKQGYIIQNGWTAGLIMDSSHRWLTFDATRKGYLGVNPARSAKSNGSLTVAGRFRAAESQKSPVIFSSIGFEASLQNGKAIIRTGAAESAVDGVTVGQWHSAVFSYNGATGKQTVSLDGLPASSGPGHPPSFPIAECRVGRALSDAPETQFGGDIEAIRVLDAPVSENWIRATALNLSESNPLIQPGRLEQASGKPALPPPPELLTPTPGAQSHKPAGIALTWRQSLGVEGYEVRLFADAGGKKLLQTIPVGSVTQFTLTASQASTPTIYWTVASISAQGKTPARELRQLAFHHPTPPGEGLSVAQQVSPVLQRASHLQLELQGYFGNRINRLANAMIHFTEKYPGLLRMLRERPEKDVPSWAGVFPGQYLSSAQLMWRLTHNPELKTTIDRYVRELIKTQRTDGYLDVFAGMDSSLSLWNHYAALGGLLDYYEDTRDPAALSAACKVADLVISHYGPQGTLLPKTGGASEAISHAIVRLYRASHDPRYLDFANYLMHEVWNEPGGVAYYRLGHTRAPLSEFPVRRWESVHNVMALSEMYWLNGESDYRNSFEHLWRTLLKTERHNTGGFSTNEGLLGTAYNRGTIETCCTVAWSLLTTDMLKLSGDSRVADELEWSMLNSALGSISFDGQGITYGTQPDGLRQFNVLRQGPPDSLELSCCSTNGARALGNLADWALMQKQDGLVLNYYGPSRLSTELESGNRVAFEQVTRYPAHGDIRISVRADRPESFTFYLRIPAWSGTTEVTLNGQTLPTPPPGGYLPIHRTWNTGDTLKLKLDFTPRFEFGKEDYAGKVSIFQGPLLFSCDARYDTQYPKNPVPLVLEGLKIEPLDQTDEKGPWVRARLTDGQGTSLTVCDFSSAGLFGDNYFSWFDLKAVPKN